MKTGFYKAGFLTTCFACGARYRPQYFFTEKTVVASSNHVCDPVKLAKREEELRHEFDDDEAYCECDDLDCKFEYLEQLKMEME